MKDNKKFNLDIMTIIGFAVAALFIVFGFYIIYAMNIQKEFRTIFGVTVIGYGLFRMVYIYQKSKRRESEDETDI